jgi:large conductance mechanosensitive channel
MIKEFRDFLVRGNLVELAVAFVMGLAFAAVVTSFVDDLVMPVIAMIFGKPTFNDLTFTINDAVFRYGSFFTAVIQFVAIAAAVFFFVVKPMNALLARAKFADEEPAAPAPDVQLLTEIRDLLRDGGPGDGSRAAQRAPVA